ncbi:hypothetical protein NliqN6_0577 [Naganishia liquefaciens]|uniref:Uncharacterized protein n=1 Tax=Naganishia liquefaciens TaxID=104408 RepID=A0A8H3YCC8_9TREE|nr:hypothetical protein NliqN6_0577 [Naganishia liquefaciens]
MPPYANRNQSFSTGSPASPSVAGLSLFHDTRRAQLADDLSFLCGDIQFPVLSRVKAALTNICGPTTRAKPVKTKTQTESSTFSSLKNMLSCRSHSIDTSFFDEKDIRQSSLRSAITLNSSQGEPITGDLTQYGEKQSAKCLCKRVSQFTSSSRQVNSESLHSRFSDASLFSNTFDASRMSPSAIIRHRRAMLPLWIDTALARFYPSNTESQHTRHSQGLFPSSSETLSIARLNSPVGQSGFKVDVHRLAKGRCRRAERIEVKQPRDKWNGNWI